MRIDLHAHTNASDGSLSPREMVSLATEHLDVIAITDHDTVDGIAEAQDAAHGTGLRVVAGIEVSTEHEGRNVHVLGLFVDPGAPALAEAAERMRAERSSRARRMVERLQQLGYEITFADVEAQTEGRIIGRPHVARALAARGHVSDPSEAFTAELIADGGRATVPRRLPDPVDGVRLVHEAGGVAVIAHPGVRHHAGAKDPIPDAYIAELARAGLDGLEVDHPDHDQATRDRLRRLAQELGLVATGGSDAHGRRRRLGTCTTAPDAFAALVERATSEPGG